MIGEFATPIDEDPIAHNPSYRNGKRKDYGTDPTVTNSYYDSSKNFKK